MPSGIYDKSRRSRGKAHYRFKHGAYIGENRSEIAKAVKRAAQRRYYAAHPERRLEQQRRYREANRDKIRLRAKEYSQRPETRARANAARRTVEGKAKRHKEYLRWKDSNPEIRRWAWIKQKYGLTPADYQRMLESQNGSCKICGRGPTGNGVGKILEVDHCHRTGTIRGLLCRRCNTGISWLEKDPQLLAKMVTYLKATHIRVEVA